MLSRTERQQIFSSSLFGSLTVAAVVFIGILLLTSVKAGASSGESTIVAGLGPLQLVEINRTPLENGGVQGTIRILGGMVTYIILSVIAGLLLAFFADKPQPPSRKRLI